jgi:phosphoglycerate dehydrogenase-like enzyme
MLRSLTRLPPLSGGLHLSRGFKETFITSSRRVLSLRSMSSSANSHLVVLGIPFPDAHRARFTPHFSSITHFPSAKDADADALAHADVLYGQAHTLRGIGQIPRARFIQLSNAGADDVLDKLFWKEDPAAREVVMTTVAGIHMAPISQVRPPSLYARAHADRARAGQYFIMAVFALYHALQAQIVIGQVEKRWGTADEVGGGRMFVQELHGKTVGVLGYGHVRLLLRSNAVAR